MLSATKLGEPIPRSRAFIADLTRNGYICLEANVSDTAGRLFCFPPNIHPHTNVGLTFEKQAVQIVDDYPLFVWTVWKAVRGHLIRISRAEFDSLPNTSQARWTFHTAACQYMYGDKTLVEELRRSNKSFGFLEKPEVRQWLRNMSAS